MISIHKSTTLLFILFLWFQVATQAQETINVKGTVQVPEGQPIPEDGLAVVLLKFRLDANGSLTTDGPISRSQTNPSGQFQFDNIPLDPRAAYRVGSRFQGDLVSSNFFAFQSGQTEVEVDVIVPRISENMEAIELSNAALFIEAGIGWLQMTEVLRVMNPTQDIIDTRNNPLAFELPEGHENLQVMHDTGGDEQSYEVLGNKIQFHRDFDPGDTTLVFQYTVPVLLSSYTLRKNYPYNMEVGRVLTPVNHLVIESDQLKESGSETLGGAELATWEITNLDHPQLTIRIGAVPVNQLSFGFLGIGVFLVLIVLALVFMQTRLAKAGKTNGHEQS